MGLFHVGCRVENHRDEKKSAVILRECVDSKYAAQSRHFAQTGGDPVSYAKLLAKKYQAAMKRRSVNHGPGRVATPK